MHAGGCAVRVFLSNWGGARRRPRRSSGGPRSRRKLPQPMTKEQATARLHADALEEKNRSLREEIRQVKQKDETDFAQMKKDTDAKEEERKRMRKSFYRDDEGVDSPSPKRAAITKTPAEHPKQDRWKSGEPKGKTKSKLNKDFE